MSSPFPFKNFTVVEQTPTTVTLQDDDSNRRETISWRAFQEHLGCAPESIEDVNHNPALQKAQQPITQELYDGPVGLLAWLGFLVFIALVVIFIWFATSYRPI